MCTDHSPRARRAFEDAGGDQAVAVYRERYAEFRRGAPKGAKGESPSSPPKTQLPKSQSFVKVTPLEAEAICARFEASAILEDGRSRWADYNSPEGEDSPAQQRLIFAQPEDGRGKAE